MADKRASVQTATLTPADAQALLARVDADPSIVNISGAVRQLGALQAALGRARCRMACLASFTMEPIVPALQLQAIRSGLALDVHVGPFGQIEQQLLDAGGGVEGVDPDVVLVAARLADVCPAVCATFAGMTGAAAQQAVDAWLDGLHAALRAFRGRHRGVLLIQNLEQPADVALGMADAAADVSQRGLIDRANDRLRAIADALPNCYTMDYDALIAAHGRRRWTDARTMYYARIPVAPRHYWDLAGFYVRYLRPLHGLTRKVLVLDADHTLWDGVVGDVGLHGIALGPDYPGNAFVAFQQRVLNLYHRGVVLCIASKNEPGAVEEVLDKHPDMVLRREHFAAISVNWDDKPTNVRRMAADLNLGLESFVFLDDSPVECELMRVTLPDVLPVCLPRDPAGYPAVVDALDCFDQFHVSEEDRSRGRLYQAESRRAEIRHAATDLDAFCRQLAMRLSIYVDHAPHVARAAQMTNRTNQFNMHTVRCTEDDIRGFMQQADSEIVTVALQDRFGDSGVIGLAVVNRASDQWTLHMLLMSCRVLGRGAEQAFASWLASRARSAGARRLAAEFAPTAKNRPFAGFYGDLGFKPAEARDELQMWRYDLATAGPNAPDWFEIEVHEAETVE